MSKALYGRVDASQFRELAGKTSQLQPALKRALRKQIKAAAEIAAADVRGTVQQPPDSGGKGPGTGLRQGIAAGVKVTLMTGTRAGVVIRATTSALPEGQKTLVRAYGKEQGWRHPVPGTDRWVLQRGKSYFGPVIATHTGAVTDAVQVAMYQALETLK